MNEQETRVTATVAQLLATVENPWESLPWALGKHPCSTMGDPKEVGTAAWHLMHMTEIFRIHAKAVMGEAEISGWPTLNDEQESGLESAAQTLRADVERFVAWCIQHPDRCSTVHHGEDMPFEEMIGVMLRHIVWHSAAVHYWCIWKGSAADS